MDEGVLPQDPENGAHHEPHLWHSHRHRSVTTALLKVDFSQRTVVSDKLTTLAFGISVDMGSEKVQLMSYPLSEFRNSHVHCPKVYLYGMTALTWS